MERAEELVERLWRKGQWEDLLVRAQEDLASGRVARDPLKQSEALSLMASVHGAMGNWRESLRAARTALRIRRQLGDALGTARALGGLSSAYLAERGTRQALHLFRMTNDAFRRVDEVEDRCHAAGMLGLILISLDRTLEAHAVLDEAINLCGDDDFAWCRWMLLEIKSRAFQEEQDLDSAILCMEEAFLMRQREEALSAACLRTIADLYLESGRVWEATEMYRMAIAHAREAGADRERERTEAKVNGLKHPRKSERGRLTLPGCKLPPWERAH